VEHDKVKTLAEAKAYLEKRLEALEAEVRVIKALLALVDQALGRESFVSAAELRREEVPRERVEEKPISEFNIMTRQGETIAKMYVYKRKIVVKPQVKLHVDTPPFMGFLIKRTLEGYKRKDLRRLDEGEIGEEDVLDYEIIEGEDGTLSELIVKNYGDRQRFFELRGAIRWTLNKMYEKEHSK